MIRKLILALTLAIFSSRAAAQTVEADLAGMRVDPQVASYLAGIIPAGAALDNNVALQSDNQAGSLSLKLLKANTSDQTEVIGHQKIRLKIAPTPGAVGTPEVDVVDGGLSFVDNQGLLIAPTSIGVAAGAASTPQYSLESGGINFSGTGTQPIYPAAAVITPKTDLTPAAGARLSARNNAIATAGPTAQYVFVVPTANVGKALSVYNQSGNPLPIIPESGTINAAAAFTPFICATTKDCECKGYSTGQMVCSAK